jgi:hypothetical protein
MEKIVPNGKNRRQKKTKTLGGLDLDWVERER